MDSLAVQYLPVKHFPVSQAQGTANVPTVSAGGKVSDNGAGSWLSAESQEPAP